MLCINCNKDFIENKHSTGQKFCSIKCKNQYNYNSKSIKVLKDKELITDPRFDWKLSEDLSIQYNKPIEWIKRGLLSCRNAGVEIDYFINKYLLKQDIEINKEVIRESILINRNRARY